MAWVGRGWVEGGRSGVDCANNHSGQRTHRDKNAFFMVDPSLEAVSAVDSSDEGLTGGRRAFFKSGEPAFEAVGVGGSGFAEEFLAGEVGNAAGSGGGAGLLEALVFIPGEAENHETISTFEDGHGWGAAGGLGVSYRPFSPRRGFRDWFE